MAGEQAGSSAVEIDRVTFRYGAIKVPDELSAKLLDLVLHGFSSRNKPVGGAL